MIFFIDPLSSTVGNVFKPEQLWTLKDRSPLIVEPEPSHCETGADPMEIRSRLIVELEQAYRGTGPVPLLVSSRPFVEQRPNLIRTRVVLLWNISRTFVEPELSHCGTGADPL